MRLLGDDEAVSPPLDAKLVDIGPKRHQRCRPQPIGLHGQATAGGRGAGDCRHNCWLTMKTSTIRTCRCLSGGPSKTRRFPMRAVVLELIESQRRLAATVGRAIHDRAACPAVCRRRRTIPRSPGCAELLDDAPNDDSVERGVSGMLQVLSAKLDHVARGRSSAHVAVPLSKPVRNPAPFEPALRVNVADASTAAMTVVADRKRATGGSRRAGQGPGRSCASPRPSIAWRRCSAQTKLRACRSRCSRPLAIFKDDRIADAVLAAYPRLALSSQARAVELLCSRAGGPASARSSGRPGDSNQVDFARSAQVARGPRR